MLNEKAFQEAYKIAKIEAGKLMPKLMVRNISESEITILKQNVYRRVIETYLAFNELDKEII